MNLYPRSHFSKRRGCYPHQLLQGFFLQCIFVIFLICSCSFAEAQRVENIYKPNIATAQLNMYGNQQSLPVYALNSGDRLMLSFDDLDGGVKSYYYSFVLCDYNWQPTNLNPFDYIKGFTQNRISSYRYSSIAFTRYTHYEAILPDRNSLPTKSGNYLLKVFLDADTSKLVFTKQMMVVDLKSNITATVIQPFTAQLFNTHQRLRFSASINGLNSFSAAQQVKAVILQNNRWDIAQRDIVPTFVRGNTLEYNTENVAVFPAGKEWRWLDLRSFRLQSDRIDSGSYKKSSTELFVKPDVDRSSQRYVYFPDYDGMYNIITYESINPQWQGDYASVYFTYIPPDGKAYSGEDLYLAGGFTGYSLSDKWKMKYNDEKAVYETSAFLKQGYYNYTYLLANDNKELQPRSLEGSYWETENSYTILLYYKSFTDRTDQLIGISQVNSRNDRPGFSF
ncbi:MAG: DUF5103 domain-containing protein [Ferruginibacter sp.]